MESINLDNFEPQETYGHTSKGNQLKWRVDGYWYKADHMGYEGLAEVLVSQLLKCSDIAYPVVQYEPAEIVYHGKSYHGCKSKDFLAPGWSLIPLEKLFRQYTGESLAMKMAAFSEVADRIRFMAEETERFTGITGFGAYLTAMMEIDCFFLNEDRHTNNIAVLYNADEDKYALCPIFDQGLSLLADTSMDFPLERPFDECLKAVDAKPFLTTFDGQLDAAEELYGIQIHFNFTEKQMMQMLSEQKSIYGDAVCNRVEAILRKQKSHLSYMMRG